MSFSVDQCQTKGTLIYCCKTKIGTIQLTIATTLVLHPVLHKLTPNGETNPTKSYELQTICEKWMATIHIP